jgi:hypothetical protein
MCFPSSVPFMCSIFNFGRFFSPADGPKWLYCVKTENIILCSCPLLHISFCSTPARFGTHALCMSDIYSCQETILQPFHFSVLTMKSSKSRLMTGPRLSTWKKLQQFRNWRILTMVYSTLKYWASGLCPRFWMMDKVHKPGNSELQNCSINAHGTW